jgi:hypothetical protein
MRVESSVYLNEHDFAQSESDVVFSVRLRADPSQKVFLSAEHQSEQRKVWQFPLRILQRRL